MEKFTDGKSSEELKAMADKTALHLKRLSDQNALVYGMTEKSLTIKELIVEVENLTEIGLFYINSYFGGLEKISNL